VNCNHPTAGKSAFTLIEILVAAGVFGLFAAAMLTTWGALQTSAMNTTSYAQRQNDQMRVCDYLKRDIRRASNLEIYNSATLVTGTAFGSELRLTIPDYYADAREDDNAIGANVPITPALSSGDVTYGSAMTVRFYVSNGAVIRDESGTARTLADSAGAFTLSFSRETSGLVRCRVLFDQRMRSGGNRTLRRQVDVLCGQRSQLH
jgi:prepilin-type N-terminal cleavage/methylation domain-containing protein